MSPKVKPTRSMDGPVKNGKPYLPSNGPLVNNLRARAALHNMAGVLDYCTWCGSSTGCTVGGAVICPSCDVVPPRPAETA